MSMVNKIKDKKGFENLKRILSVDPKDRNNKHSRSKSMMDKELANKVNEISYLNQGRSRLSEKDRTP